MLVPLSPPPAQDTFIMDSTQLLPCSQQHPCVSANWSWVHAEQGIEISQGSDNYGHYNLSLPQVPVISGGGAAGSTPGNWSLIDETSMQSSINTFMQRYLTPVIIVVGVVGNMASLAVFRTSRLRRQTSTVHLSALAVSDTGFLITLLFSWLGWFRVYIVHQQPWCVLVVYLTYVCSFLSVWIVVTFTVERFIVACFPLQRKRILRPRTTKLILVALTLVALIGYSFATWMTGVIDVGGKDVCAYYPKYQRVMNILMHIDTAITFVIPMFIIIILNSAIAIAVYRTQRTLARSSHCTSHSFRRPTVLTYLEPSLVKNNSTYRSFNKSSRKNVVVTLSNCSMTSQERAKRHIRATKMLLVVSTVFVVLNLPVHTLKVYAAINQMVNPNWMQPTAERLWMHTFELVYYFNFAINFFLYSLCAQNFRRCLLASCLKIKSRIICFRSDSRLGTPSEPPLGKSGENNISKPTKIVESTALDRLPPTKDEHDGLSDWSSASRS